MRKIAADNAELNETNAELSKENQAMKLARRMEQRGLEPGLDFEAKVAHIMSMDQAKIATFEQAIEMAHSGFSLGAADTEDKTAAGGSSDGDVLSNFITSQAAFHN
jgi:hypothetical protein